MGCTDVEYYDGFAHNVLVIGGTVHNVRRNLPCYLPLTADNPEVKWNRKVSDDKKTETVVQVDDLRVSFDGFVAVDGISFKVAAGEALGILGSNGAGKSSTMKALAGIVKPAEGSIRINDAVLTTRAEEEYARSLLGYCPDVGGLVVGATPREHLQLLTMMHRSPEKYETGLFLVEKIGLAEFLDTPVGGFSHGMSRRLSVVLATLSAKKLLILDEPFDGVDPVGVDAIEGIVQEARNAGLATIICTHLQPLLARTTDRVQVMSHGKIIDTLPAKKLEGVRGERLYKSLLGQSGTN